MRSGTGEVIQAVDPVSGVVLREEHGAGAVFHPGEQSQMIGAEVEHGGKGRVREGAMSSRPLPAAPLRGHPADSSARDIITERRLLGASTQGSYSVGGWLLWDLRRLSPPSRKISEFSTRRSTIAVAMVVL